MADYSKSLMDFLSLENFRMQDETTIKNGPQIKHAALTLTHLFNTQSIRRLGLYAENSVDWAIVDFAAQLAGIVLLPLPKFFSKDQIEYCIEDAGLDAIITDNPELFSELNFNVSDTTPSVSLYLIRRPILSSTPPLPSETQKITYTSGSTGTPKGVCLSIENQWRVAIALNEAIRIENPKHLCLLPLSTLLENVAGIYVPLIAEGVVCIPGSKKSGLGGSSRLNLPVLLQCISNYQPNTLILTPQLLGVLITACERGWDPPASLRFIAVGGGKVSPALVNRANELKLPVYEGYGLSECASVVCLNTRQHKKSGSVGKPLPHIQLTIRDNEIFVSGNSFLGYVGENKTWHPSLIPTGDLGKIDSDGFVEVTGRKNNLLISSFGRNISPEWLEAELSRNGMIQQCIVVGDARPFCVALLYADILITDSQIEDWLNQTNRTLPDYAQIFGWIRIDRPFSVADDLLTENGRPRRQQIHEYYEVAINELYEHAASQELLDAKQVKQL